MLRINRKVEYALIALKHMEKAGAGRPVSAREISSNHQLSRDLVSKVLQNLTAGGILTSEQGKHGGYRIAAPLNGLSVLMLHELLEGPFVYASCTGGQAHACLLEKRCTVAGPVRYLGKRIRELFSNINLKDLLEEENDCPPFGDKKSVI